MEAEDQEFCELMEAINCSTFHMNNEEARPIIDIFLTEHPELLKIHDKEWYYKYC
jgi:hypothetical protein